jgi:hypothetical protein
MSYLAETANGLKGARLPFRRVREIGCVGEDLFRRSVNDN